MATSFQPGNPGSPDTTVTGSGGGSVGVVDPIGGILSVAGTVYTNETNKMMNEANNRLNKELYYDARNYNTPVNQMKRLEQAGLNPALYYGTGSGANVTSPPPRMEASSIENPLANYQQVRNLETQRENIVQNTENAKKTASLIDAQTKSVKLDNVAKAHNNANVKDTPANTNENTFWSQVVRGVKWLGLLKNNEESKQAKDKREGNVNVPSGPDRVTAREKSHGEGGSW